MKKNKSNISVIIPVYNVEKYLRECLESVINQKGIDYEIICVNDGSTDNSLKILQDYYNNKKIIIIDKENAGLSSARNYGLKIANGEYIFFLDSDDYLTYNFALLDIYNIAKKENLDVLSFNYENDNKKFNIKKTANKLFNGKSYLKNGRTSVIAWNKLYSNKYLKKIKFYFYEGIIHEDDESYLRLIYHAKKIMHIKISVIYYRMNENSITKQKYSYKNIDGYIKTIESHLNLYNFSVDTDTKIFIKKRLFFYVLKIAQLHIDVKTGANNNFFEEYSLPFNKFETILLKYNVLNIYNQKNQDIYFLEKIVYKIARRIEKIYFTILSL